MPGYRFRTSHEDSGDHKFWSRLILAYEKFVRVTLFGKMCVPNCPAVVTCSKKYSAARHETHVNFNESPIDLQSRTMLAFVMACCSAQRRFNAHFELAGPT